MSLFYPASEQVSRGKTSEREDRFTARFVELTPPTRIVHAIAFDSVDPAFSGEMTLAVTCEERDGGTDVSIAFEHIPSGIRPAGHEAGCRSSLEKLALSRVGKRKVLLAPPPSTPTPGRAIVTLPPEVRRLRQRTAIVLALVVDGTVELLYPT
jgi:hypothetical protein